MQARPAEYSSKIQTKTDDDEKHHSIAHAPCADRVHPAHAKKNKKATWAKGYTQNDWNLGYGYKSCLMIVDRMQELELSHMSSTIEAANRTSIGTISFGYTHRPTRFFSFGIQAGFELTKEDCVFNNTTYNASHQRVDNYSKVGELTNRYITVTPLIRLNWAEYSKDFFRIYSKFAVGMTFIGDSFTNMSETETYVVQSKKQHYFGYQVSPLGFVWGRKAGSLISNSALAATASCKLAFSISFS